MNNYELTVVVDGKATPAKQKNLTELVEKIVNVMEGKMGKVEEWGKKDLAYKMGKSTIGIFFHFPIELKPSAAKGLETKLKAEDSIIKYLLVRKSK